MAFDSEKAKNFLLSKTVWGVVAMGFAIFSDSLGIKLEAGIDDIIAGLGAVFALWGRFSASQVLTFFSPKKDVSGD